MAKAKSQESSQERDEIAPPPDGRGRRRRHARRHLRRAGRASLSMLLVFALLVAAGVFGFFALTGKPIRLPVWVVAEIEARSNAALARDMAGAAIAIGGVEIRIDDDWTPRLQLEDLRLLQGQGATLLALPDVRLVFDPVSVLTRAELRPQSLRLIGGDIALRRFADGTLDLQLGANAKVPPIKNISDLLGRIDVVLGKPFLSRLKLVEAEATSLTLKDALTGRVWSIGDGRIRLDVRPDQLAAEVAVSLVGGGEAPAQAVVTLIRPRDEPRIRVTASVDQVAARDIAAATPLIGWLGVLAAPISGRISTEITDNGVEALDGEISLAAGALQPTANARPIPFDRAEMRLGYDPDRGRISISNLSVESRTLRLKAQGHSYPADADGQIMTGPLGQRLPAAFLGQLEITEARIDPEGLFERPLVFTHGAMDARLKLNPFELDIGQISLTEERNRRLNMSGHAAVLPEGWSLAVDLGLDAIAHDRLLQLWPNTLVPKTREWVGQNVAKGLLTNLNAALRVQQGQEPRLSLGYEFDGAEVTFLRTLPPITEGRGRSSIEGKTYMIVLEGGKVQAPEGGEIDVTGSTFQVPDVTEKPARANIHLTTRSTITAALSLLDLPPFGFMTKAGQPADLGEGLAIVDTQLSLPLQRRVQLEDVRYNVEGELRQVRSDKLIKGKMMVADRLRLKADPKGLNISGAGEVGAVPFDVTFHQGFGAESKGRSQITGTVALSPATLQEFSIALPKGMVSGKGRGTIKVDLVKDHPGSLNLTSDLAGLGLRIDAVGWSKGPGTKGKLDVDVQLGQPPQVKQLALTAPGLSAKGNVGLKSGGGLDRAVFGEVTLGDWMAGAVTLTGRGGGRAPDIAVTGGQIDLRRFDPPKGAANASSSAGALSLVLDRLIVTDAISLVGFQGDFNFRGGLNGAFKGSVNGAAPIRGEAVPSRFGTAIRLTSANAGQVLQASGIFTTARDGSLTFSLSPLAQKGAYSGRAEIRDVRVRKTSALAELLSAVSVVGLLEQLNGSGIMFNTADFDLILTPNAVEISNGTAVGASLGVTLAGLYATKTKQLALQGVISPIYLVNGIGAALTRRGEGLFGFNYSLSGTSDNPDVSVNPFSILTPGMFRDIFRSPPPVLGKTSE